MNVDFESNMTKNILILNQISDFYWDQLKNFRACPPYILGNTPKLIKLKLEA